MKVVIADDSVEVRRHLVAMLSALERVQVIAEAGDVGSAVETVRSLRPEVVVLDIQMPGGNGIIALKQIKRECPDTQVIMLTNHANPFYRKACLSAGASYFFDKSIEFEKVSEALGVLQNGQA